METATERAASPIRVGCDLFLISVLVLFLELACIRWFPAHVLFLTFFTNMVLLACFLGMSVGCLASASKRNYLAWTPILLMIGMASAHGIEVLRNHLQNYVDVGNQLSPQLVFFGTEYHAGDVDRFVIPIEVLGGFFFLIIALAMVGPGQELGRAPQSFAKSDNSLHTEHPGEHSRDCSVRRPLLVGDAAFLVVSSGGDRPQLLPGRKATYPHVGSSWSLNCRVGTPDLRCIPGTDSRDGRASLVSVLPHRL